MRVKTGLSVILLLIIAVGLYWLYPTLLYQVMEWQKSFNLSLSSALHALKAHEQQAGWTLVGISFLYGVFHAVGPGHGKVILSSYLSLENTAIKHAMKISLASALVQGLVAVSLVSVIVVVFTLSRQYFNLTLLWVERMSFALMLLFGLYWVYRAYQAQRKASSPKMQFRHFTPLQKNVRNRPLVTRSSLNISSSHDSCGCGHQHLPSQAELQKPQDWRTSLMLIFSIGIRPCSGAILVLFLAYTLDIYAWGMLSAMAMALGTGITLCLFALLVLGLRQKAVSLSRFYFSTKTNRRLLWIVQFGLGLLLVVMAILLLHSSFLTENVPNMFFKR